MMSERKPSDKRLRIWQIPVTETLDKLLDAAVRVDTHVSKSDLVRDAVREKLTNMGLTYEKLPENRVKRLRGVRLCH